VITSGTMTVDESYIEDSKDRKKKQRYQSIVDDLFSVGSKKWKLDLSDTVYIHAVPKPTV
jgi:hypothetical protein